MKFALIALASAFYVQSKGVRMLDDSLPEVSDNLDQDELEQREDPREELI